MDRMRKYAWYSNLFFNVVDKYKPLWDTPLCVTHVSMTYLFVWPYYKTNYVLMWLFWTCNTVPIFRAKHESPVELPAAGGQPTQRTRYPLTSEGKAPFHKHSPGKIKIINGVQLDNCYHLKKKPFKRSELFWFLYKLYLIGDFKKKNAVVYSYTLLHRIGLGGVRGRMNTL